MEEAARAGRDGRGGGEVVLDSKGVSSNPSSSPVHSPSSTCSSTSSGSPSRHNASKDIVISGALAGPIPCPSFPASPVTPATPEEEEGIGKVNRRVAKQRLLLFFLFRSCSMTGSESEGEAEEERKGKE